MSIIRRKTHTRSYVVLDKGFLTDERLPWDTRGVLAYLLSLPDEWEIQTAHLVTKGNLGRDGMQRVLRDLEAAGYLLRIKARNEDGTYTWIKEVYEVPQPAQPATVEPSTPKPVVNKKKNLTNNKDKGSKHKTLSDEDQFEQYRLSAERVGGIT